MNNKLKKTALVTITQSLAWLMVYSFLKTMTKSLNVFNNIPAAVAVSLILAAMLIITNIIAYTAAGRWLVKGFGSIKDYRRKFLKLNLMVSIINVSLVFAAIYYFAGGEDL